MILTFLSSQYWHLLIVFFHSVIKTHDLTLPWASVLPSGEGMQVPTRPPLMPPWLGVFPYCPHGFSDTTHVGRERAPGHCEVGVEVLLPGGH